LHRHVRARDAGPEEGHRAGEAICPRARNLDSLAGDTNNVVPTVCEAVITSVFNTASERLA